MTHLLVPRGRTFTQDVVRDERIGYWEAQSASRLVGLRCSTHAADGLQACATHYDLGPVQLTDIAGNQHVIERTRELLSTHPKDSLFACFLLEGEAFFFQGDACVLVRAGDIIVYSTAQAYLYGFSTAMRQIILECDAGTLLGEAERPQRVIHLEKSSATASTQALAVDLKAAVLGFVHQPLQSQVGSVAWRCRAALHALITGKPYGDEKAGPGPDWNWRLHQAQTYILDNLLHADLSAASVAQALGVSVRHLHRIFQAQELSPVDWIWQQRVLCAGKLLGQAGGGDQSLSDLAYRLGFATASHFSRSFRKHYQMSPTAFRKLQQGASLQPPVGTGH